MNKSLTLFGWTLYVNLSPASYPQPGDVVAGSIVLTKEEYRKPGLVDYKVHNLRDSILRKAADMWDAPKGIKGY